MLMMMIIIILSFFKFSFFSNNFTTKMREKQMIILMFCDRPLRKKTEWEYRRNRNFLFRISSATILYSLLPHPFLGNCEMVVAPAQKKKDLNFRLFKWTNGIMSMSFALKLHPRNAQLFCRASIFAFEDFLKPAKINAFKLFSMPNIMTVQYHKERLSRRRCRFFRIFERAITVHF